MRPNNTDNISNVNLLLWLLVGAITQSMFSHAVNHRKKKADIEERNAQKLSPLALASKLGRFQLFNEIIQLQSCVRIQHYFNHPQLYVCLTVSLGCNFHHYHHHIRLFEVVKRNRQHTLQKIDVGIYMDIHTIHAG